MSARTAVVTGSTHGIGLVTARELARAGWRVLMLVRDPALGAQVQAAIGAAAPGSRVEVVRCDLASLASVRAAADEVAQRAPRLQLLVNNAGTVSLRQAFTTDGFERVFAVNHLGPFLLTERLRPALAAGAQVINVASCVHAQATLDLGAVEGHARHPRYRAQAAYAQSKLANVLHALALARQGVRANALHPGIVHTHLLPWWLDRLKPLVRRGMVDAAQGARSTLFLALDPRAAALSGAYVDERQRVVAPAPLARSQALQDALWAASERWVAPFNAPAAPAPA